MPPGVAITLLAFSTCIYAALIANPSPLEKGLWIAGFFLLAIAEIGVLFRERNEHDKEMARINAENLERFKVALARSNLTLARLDNLTRLHTVDPKNSLRESALELCEEILDFVDDRMQRESGPKYVSLSSLAGGEKGFAALESIGNVFAYSAETAKMYSKRYTHRVADTFTKLAEYGLTDAELNNLSQKVEWSHDVVRLADRLRALAEKLG